MKKKKVDESTASAGLSGSGCLLPKSLLKGYYDNTALIRFENKYGVIQDWFIGAMSGVDNETTLREHLKKCMPSARRFVGWVIK